MVDTTDQSDAAIEVRGLVKEFPPDVRAVDGLDLRVARGECFGLLGPNGAGKTTTIEILEGIQRPTSGEVLVLGLRWEQSATSLRRRIGIQLQETELYDKLSVAETVTMFRSFYERKVAVDEIIQSVGLTEKRDVWVSKLSGGQKQRLAIACALVSEPELVFLDEPTTGLDPAARRALWDIIRGLRGRGRTVMLTTHYMEEAEKLCDRIAIVNRGKVIALGTPRELIARLGSDEIIELETEPGLQAGQLATVRGVVACHTDGAGLRLAVKEIHVALPSVLDAVKAAGARPSRLTTRHATLDDVFVELTGKTIGEAEQSGGKSA
jgi:ABC-2 type transport system ATP-binding protein